jgi:hypothetical protein
MANPRDHIRAAQAAELRGDKAGAVAELLEAAALYRSMGNTARALQLMRHARTLDPSRTDIAEEISRLEWLPDTSIASALQEQEPIPVGAVLELKFEPDELEARQRLIEEALKQAGLPGAKEAQDEVKRWLVEEPAGAGASPGAPTAARPRPADVSLEVKALVTDDMKALVAEVDLAPGQPSTPERLPERMAFPSELRPFQQPDTPPAPEKEEPRGEKALFDRGPTRADPAIDAWCSFCCRPRSEVGELVAGPTGSFICAGCVGESRGLLGLEDTPPSARPRPARRRDEEAGAPELVGQQEARALLERGLQAGVRRLLVVGPEGTGKSVWFRGLVRQERGDVATVDTLEQGSGGPVVLVEDVDRLAPEVQARLASFLARHPERTVLMSARGTLDTPGLVLRGAAGSLPVLTTSALSQAVRGSVTVALLEQVQLAVPLHAPTEAEFLEIARRWLAPRAPALSISDEVLAAFASEAARSPRSGHELSALLARVPAGSWSLESGSRPAGAGEPAGKGAGVKEAGPTDAEAKPGRRGRRKGSS